MNAVSEKRKILVTGVSGDIGSFIASEFIRKGWIVLGLDKKEMVSADSTIEFYKCDLGNYTETETIINSIVDKHGAFDVVINCAGMIVNAPIVSIVNGKFTSHDPKTWNDIITANLSTTFNVSTIAVKHMIVNRKKGVIINISSIIANGNAGQTAYSSAKAGVNGFTKSLAKELGQFGIRVVCISPGFFDTDSTKQNISETKLSQIKEAIPLKKLGDVSEIVQTIEYVINTDYINGAIIELNGGLAL